MSATAKSSLVYDLLSLSEASVLQLLNGYGRGKAAALRQGLLWVVAGFTLTLAADPPYASPRAEARLLGAKHGLWSFETDYTDDKELLFGRLTTLWLTMDAAARCFRGLKSPDGLCGRVWLLPRLGAPNTAMQESLYTVQRDDVDENGHMNHARAAALIERLLDAEPLRSLSAVFTAETLPDTCLTLRSLKADGRAYLDAEADGKPRFRLLANYGKVN